MTRRVIAIVGARAASSQAAGFAFGLAYHLARAGVTVASGGAVGIDTCVHRGAIAGGGATWVVACTGRGEVFPSENEALFGSIEASESSRMIWPFRTGTRKNASMPRFRNGVLVALSECLVVVQAAPASGSRNAASWGRRLGRPVYVVPGAPWDFAFMGSVMEGAAGARALWSIEWFFDTLRLPPPDMKDPGAASRGVLPPSAPVTRRRPVRERYSDAPLFAVEKASWSREENLVFSALSLAPLQQDEIIQKVGLGTSSTLTALLTLSLKDVVVEGPDGFFRRRDAT